MTNINFTKEEKEKLVQFQNILINWQEKINLISNTTKNNIWERHILDSADLANHIEKNKKILDIGSGAGFPGIVLSILGYDVTLVDSNNKKCIFLKTVKRDLKLKTNIINVNIQELNNNVPRGTLYDIVTCRAFSSIDNVFGFSENLLKKGGFFLFLKGVSYKEELTIAEKKWKMNISIYHRKEKDGVILKVSQVVRRFDVE